MNNETYTTVQGDTWDVISYKVYGDEHYVDILLQANIAYMNMTILPANIELSIPDIEIKPFESLPPWKRGGISG